MPRKYDTLWEIVLRSREVDYFVTEETASEILDKIAKSKEVVVDVETDGLQPWHGNRLCGVGIAVSADEGYYFPFRHPEYNLHSSWMWQIWAVLEQMEMLTGHNLKFDLAMMYQDGYNPPRGQTLADTMMTSRLCEAPQYANLTLANQLSVWIGPEARLYNDEFEAYMRKNHGVSWKKCYHKADARIVGEYCVGDVLGTWRLRDLQEQRIEETNQTRVWETEKAVTYTLWRMESIGVQIDLDYGTHKLPQLQALIENLEQQVYAIAGYEFNLGSNPQLTQVMGSLNIKSTKKTKTGVSWDVDVLDNIKHPIAKKILAKRSLEKLVATYFVPLMEWPDGVVHCQHKNFGAVTGRMSCVDPNTQNIPKEVKNYEGDVIDSSRVHEDEAVSVRRMIVPRVGYKLYELDYSQMEMRVFADYLQDPELNALLESEFDFHDYVAERVWGVKKGDQYFGHYRRLAKGINFGLLYGMGKKLLAKKMGVPLKEAEAYKEDYFQQFPTARAFIEQVTETVEERGFIFNRFKRRYYIDKNRSYVGINYLIQGTSADIVKNRMVACQDYLEEEQLKSRMLLQWHDAMLFEIHVSEEQWLPFELRRIMEKRLIDTYLPVDIARLKSCAEPSKWIEVDQEYKAA